MSRLADFFDTGTIARLPIVADLLTGNIQGLEYSYTSAHSITITKGNCYDSFNLTVLTGSASQVVAIGTTINKVYNLFLCDDGLVKTDTDVDGATLLAGSVTALRWIGFVKTNSAGAICLFEMTSDILIFPKPSENRFVSPLISTTYTAYSVASLVPVLRVTGITIAGEFSVEQVEGVVSKDGVSDFTRFSGNSFGPGHECQFVEGWYIKVPIVNYDNGYVVITKVTLKR